MPRARLPCRPPLRASGARDLASRRGLRGRHLRRLRQLCFLRQLRLLRLADLGKALLEALDGLPQAGAQLRELRGAEEEQRQRQDDQDLAHAKPHEMPPRPLVNGNRAPPKGEFSRTSRGKPKPRRQDVTVAAFEAQDFAYCETLT